MSALPRRDRWIITSVVLALAALIAGFAMSAPAFLPEHMGSADFNKTLVPADGVIRSDDGALLATPESDKIEPLASGSGPRGVK